VAKKRDYRDDVANLRYRVSLDDIAQAAGCSRDSIRQCLMPEAAQAYRKPPANLTGALIVLADQQAAYFTKLAARLRKGQ